MRRWLPLIAVLSCLCAPALAEPVAITLRHGPAEPTCVAEHPRGAVIAARWGRELGGPRTRMAWKRLLQAGPTGCDLVAKWLAGGARGGDSEDIKEVVLVLLRTGSDTHVAVAAPYITSRVPATVARAALGLQTRLAVLPEAWVANVVASASSTWPLERDQPDPRESLVGLLLGLHTEGELQFEDQGPATSLVWVESDSWGADTAPPPQHVAGIEALLATGLFEVERVVASQMDRLLGLGLPNQEVWAPLLLPLLDRPDRETARFAARALGRAAPEGLEPVVASILDAAPGWRHLPDLLAGLQLRVAAGDGGATTRSLLRRIESQGGGKSARRASRLLADLPAESDP